MKHTLQTIGLSIAREIKFRYLYITTALRVSDKSLRKMNRLGKIKYHGDLATVEVWLPKYLAEWIEKQASREKVSPSLFIKTWIQQIYNRHAEKVTK